VDGRVRNQRALLRRLNRERKDADVVRALLGLNRVLPAVAAAGDVPALLGHEGAAAALYWPAWGRLLADGWVFDVRRRRPPPDPVNAALSFLAALLERDLGAILARHGLHPAFGALHTAQDGHDACTYDLMEEFRAPLVEGLAAYLINNRILKPAMFEPRAEGRCRIARAGAEALVRGWEGWLDRPVKSPRRGRRVQWRRLIEEQAVAYADHVAGGPPYQPYVMDY
jgi:CRISPR-associated protein Cas1